MNRVAKFYTALTGALLTWGAVVVQSAPAHITSTEWLQIAGGAVTAVAVWFVPNTA